MFLVFKRTSLQSIINLLNNKGAHLNMKGVFVRQYSCPNLYYPVGKMMLH